MYALVGVRPRKSDTMQLPVEVGGAELTALLDNSSTHNFIAEEAAAKAGVSLQPRTGMSVLVANEDCLTSSGRCSALELCIGEEYFNINCHAISLDDFDVVLGVKWLLTSRPILWDLEHLQMSFTREGRQVTLHDLAAQRPKVCQEVMTKLLDEFDNIFVEPCGLPPSRVHDHRIHLLPAIEPVAIRPYRYAQHQKDELERQCDDMIGQGIIRRSSSTFFAPVLLVKKQERSWRFCMDYRALNAKAVKDKFPIPVVEELLDELQGSKFFTKLDLLSGYHQVRMHPPDVEKTAFRTHQDLFEFLVMPFSLTNALTTFQALMSAVNHSFVGLCWYFLMTS